MNLLQARWFSDSAVRSVQVRKAQDETPVKELRAFATECLNAVDPAKARICSDCVWFSRSPPPSLLTHMMNPVDGAAFKIDLGLSMPTV